VWSGWNQTFGYDAFGSLVSKTGSNSPPLSIGTNPVNNQVVGQSYDANGNQTSYNGTSLIYDTENHLLSAVGLTEYLYDSQGKRIWKGMLSGGSMTAQEVYFYGVDGQKLGTYSLGLAYSGSTVYLTDNNTNLAVFFGGKRVAVNGTAFVQDRLGSQGKYYPYGEDRNALANDQVKFATYTRDSATGLDYADQRYYSNQFGRFMTPDPYKPSASTTSPQTWNRYGYSWSDPINMLDPTGLVACGSATTISDDGVIHVTVYDCIGNLGTPPVLPKPIPVYLLPPGETPPSADGTHGPKCHAVPSLPGNSNPAAQIQTNKMFLRLPWGSATRPIVPPAECACRKLRVESNVPSKATELRTQTPLGFARSEGIQDSATKQRRLVVCMTTPVAAQLPPARLSRSSTVFRPRAGRSGDGDRQLAGQPRFVLAQVAARRAIPANPWLAQDAFEIRDSTR
jgi:RHS repeat-associated protein